MDFARSMRGRGNGDAGGIIVSLTNGRRSLLRAQADLAAMGRVFGIEGGTSSAVTTLRAHIAQLAAGLPHFLAQEDTWAQVLAWLLVATGGCHS
jgi:hypothetical protein